MNRGERRGGGQPPVLPLRPLTAGELLDSAVALLRAAAPALLPVALVLAAAEQAALWPVRAWAGVDPPAYLPGELPLYWPSPAEIGRWWVLLAVGAALETGIIALLGGLAARAAGESVLGRPVRPLRLLRQGGGGLGALPIAVLCALVTGVAALGGPLWALGYALFGLAVPALVLDRVGPVRALGRGARMAFRGGGRAAGIRVVGYLGWLAVRIALGLGFVAVLEIFNITGADWRAPVATVAWMVVNAIAYPSLACLDAVLHLETRMRGEGLDIRLARAAARGPLGPAHLAVWR